MLRLGWRVFIGSTLAAVLIVAVALALVDTPIDAGRPALATAQAALRATAVAPTPRPGAASTAVSELALQLVQEGDDLYARGELAPAIYRYTQAADKSSARANARLARALVSWGDGVGAVERAKKAVDQEPSAEHQATLCLAQHWVESFTAATEACQRAVSRDASSPLARAYLAMTLVDVGRKQEARTALQKALELSPELPEVLRAAGHVNQVLGQSAEAETALLKARTLAPRSVDVRLTLSRAYKRRDAADRAAEELARAIEELPPSPQPLAELGLILYQQKRYSEAAESLERALALDPNRASTSRLLGWSQYFQGDHARALVQFQNAARLSPKDAEAQTGIGWANLGLRRYDEARAAFEAALAISPSLSSAESGLRAVEAQAPRR